MTDDEKLRNEIGCVLMAAIIGVMLLAGILMNSFDITHTLRRIESNTTQRDK